MKRFSILVLALMLMTSWAYALEESDFSSMSTSELLDVQAQINAELSARLNIDFADNQTIQATLDNGYETYPLLCTPAPSVNISTIIPPELFDETETNESLKGTYYLVTGTFVERNGIMGRVVELPSGLASIDFPSNAELNTDNAYPKIGETANFYITYKSHSLKYAPGIPFFELGILPNDN